MKIFFHWKFSHIIVLIANITEFGNWLYRRKHLENHFIDSNKFSYANYVSDIHSIKFMTKNYNALIK